MEWLTSSPGLWVLLALALFGLCSAIGVVIRWIRAAYDRATPLSFLVLTRNQEHQIEGFIRAVLSGLRGSPRKCELVLVDLASTDSTPYILERLARKEQIGLVRLKSQEPGEAFTMAHFLAQGRVAIVIDLRGPADAPTVLRTLREIW